MPTTTHHDRPANIEGEVPASLVPLMRAARVLGLSRERTLRRIMARQLAGHCIAGRWFVDRASLDAAVVREA